MCIYRTVYVSRVLGHTVHTQRLFCCWQGGSLAQSMFDKGHLSLYIITALSSLHHPECLTVALFQQFKKKKKSVSSHFVFDPFLCPVFATKHMLPVTTVILMVSLAIRSFRV